MMNTKTIKQEISKLIEKYNKVVEEKGINKYNEEMTKKDFILPLFRALGWDTENSNEVAAEKKYQKNELIIVSELTESLNSSLKLNH